MMFFKLTFLAAYLIVTMAAVEPAVEVLQFAGARLIGKLHGILV